MRDADYLVRINSLMIELGIPPHIVIDRQLPLFPEAKILVETAAVKQAGTPLLLEPSAAVAWDMMRQAADQDGVTLLLVSAFRSIDYQADIIRRKLQRGQLLEDVLLVSAVPGYSEHHTGKALDIGDPTSSNLESSFEDTAAFEWLSQHAPSHGFSMSYPRNNKYGYIYEPWHWFFNA